MLSGLEANVLPAGYADGRALLVSLTVLLMAVCAVMGVAVTADCLSVERREGTLGLLALTPLTAFDLLLGRLGSAAIHLVYGVFAVLPLMGVSFLFGGVGFADYARLGLVLLNTVWMSLAIGLLVSTVSRNSRRALFAGFALATLIFAGPYLLGEVQAVRSGGRAAPVEPLWSVVSPVVSLTHAGLLDPLQYNPYRFVFSFLVGHGVAWGLILLAAKVLRKTFANLSLEGVVTKKQRRGRIAESLRKRGERFSAAQQRFWLERNPFAWLYSQGRARRSRVDLFVWSMALIGTMAFLAERSLGEFAIFILLFTGLFLKVWWLIEVVMAVRREREAGSYELLLTTASDWPAQTRGIGRFLWLQFGRGFVVLGMLCLFFYFTSDRLLHRELSALVAVFFWAITLSYVVDLWALKWLGIWSALTRKSIGWTLMGPLISVSLIRWLGLVCVATLWSMWRSAYEPTFSFLGSFELASVWLWVSVLGLGAVGLRGRYLVLRRMRELAMYRFDRRSAESAWLERARRQRAAAKSFWFRRLWPIRFRDQVFVGISILVVTVLSVGQVRIWYFKQRLDESLAAIDVQQVTPTFNNRWQGRGAILGDAMALLPANVRVPRGRNVVPMGSRFQFTDSPQNLPLTEQDRARMIYARDQEALEALVAVGRSLASDLDIRVPVVEDANSFTKLPVLYVVLANAIEVNIRERDVAAVREYFFTLIRISHLVAERAGGQIGDYSVAGLESALHSCREIVSSRVFRSEDWAAFGRELAAREPRLSADLACRDILQHLQWTADQSHEDWIGGRNVALAAARYGVGFVHGALGVQAAESVALSEAAGPLLNLAQDLDENRFDRMAPTIAAVRKELAWLRPYGRQANFGIWLIRTIEREQDLKVLVHLLQCVAELERRFDRGGKYPEVVGDRAGLPPYWIDPYTGTAFVYTSREHGYEIASASGKALLGNPSWSVGEPD